MANDKDQRNAGQAPGGSGSNESGGSGTGTNASGSGNTTPGAAKKAVHDIVNVDADRLARNRTAQRVMFQVRLYNDSMREVAMTAAEKLDRLSDIQRYLKLAFTRTTELAVRFAQQHDEELEFSASEMRRLDTMMKDLEKEKSASCGEPKKKYQKTGDRSNSTCRTCLQTGHWAFDKFDNGTYKCPALKPQSQQQQSAQTKKE